MARVGEEKNLLPEIEPLQGWKTPFVQRMREVAYTVPTKPSAAIPLGALTHLLSPILSAHAEPVSQGH